MRMTHGGLSKVTRGINQTIAMDVLKYSIDPDKPVGEKPVSVGFHLLTFHFQYIFYFILI